MYGICPRTHGNANRLPENTFPRSTVEDVKIFLTNYLEENTITLLGRIPGFKSEDVKILSSSETKVTVWQVYKSVCDLSGKQEISYHKLLQLWLQFCRNVVAAKPMTDLCLTCQENTAKLQRAANLSDREKSELIKTRQEHLNCAQGESDFYKYSCTTCEETLETFGTDTLLNLESQDTCSLDGIIHYSYDYAQQVHIPSNPMQPGPIYFKTPRKCGIFGVMCEGIPRQVNFLIDEAASAGKGANATISYMHYFFVNHRLGETDVHLHADYCARQNKNKYFFMVFGMENFDAPSSIYHLFLSHGRPHQKKIKKAFKVNYVSSLCEFARLVETSSNSGVNKAQLVGTHNGRVIVYDWASFLGQYFKKMPNIKKFHHFRFSKENP